MYDIYHWEAHPNSTYPEPKTLEQRVKHYEAYRKKYPFITLPGLVDDGSCSVSKKIFRASYTTIIVVDMNQKIVLRKDFPSNFSNAYKSLDAKINEITPDSTQISFLLVHNALSPVTLKYGARGSVFVNIPASVQGSKEIAVFNACGKKVFWKTGITEPTVLDLTHALSSGYYFLNVGTFNEIIAKPFLVHR